MGFEPTPWTPSGSITVVQELLCIEYSAHPVNQYSVLIQDFSSLWLLQYVSAYRQANRVDPDQAAHSGAFWSGGPWLDCFFGSIMIWWILIRLLLYEHSDLVDPD